MINKHNNISSQDALFNNVSIRDTLKSDSIEANQIIRSANPGSTGRVILNGTLTVLGNDNSIDTIKNVNITNNELEFTNELGTTTANKITQENGTTNITGGNITFNHTLEVTGDNNNVTTISDANITNNKEIEFINENGNTTADNITGESTITNGNISFNHVVTVKNQQDNQNNITSIIDSNITNNNQMKFTNQTANSLIDNITGESTINSGNISFDNIVTVKNQQDNQNNITSITDSNITNNNSMSFTNQTANTTIDTLQNGEGNLTITGGNITSNNVVTVKNQQNDKNNITSITNSTITNDNEIKLTNPTANTIIDTLQDGEGNLTITGGNITSNNVVTVKNEQNDNNNITSITDSNLTNNNSITFTKQTANTAIDTLQAGGGELTITGGNISFDNVVTIKNQQDNQNNITSISNSNINNNNSMSFTNETANTTIDTLQKGEGDLTITGGNINTNNIITVIDQSVITSLTNANITNSGTFTLNNASIDQLITSTINGPKTENDSLKETKFKYKEETLKKSTDTVTGTKYYNIPYVKVLNNVTYYGELFNKTEELNTSYVDYDMKYYYADIIYYQYQNKIIIPENQNVTVNKADQISLVNADVTNNGTLNISDGSVIQEIIGDVKFSGKVNLEAVTEIRDVDNIILEEAIITNNKGITITNESTISSIRNSNIGGDVTIDTKGHVSVDNVVNSTITNGTVTINDNITSTVINSNLVGGTVNFGENKTLTVDVKEGTLENEIIKTITDSTINNANVTLNNNITSTVTNSDLNATTIDLNNNTLTTKEGIISSFDNIDNSTITNGDVLVNNNLDSLITNSTLKDNVTIDLNTNSLNAKTGSSVNKIDNSTITNGDITVNNGLNPVLANVVLGDNVNNNVNVNLNSNLLTANSGSSVSNINKSTITNGDITVNNNLESLLTDVVLGDNVNNNVNIDLNTKSLNAKTDSSVSAINNSTITNGNVSISNNLTSSITDVTLSNITDINLNDNSLTANNGSTVSNINNSTITNGNISISNDLTSSLANVTLNNIGNVDLNTHSLNAKTDSTVSKIDNSTITNGNVTVNNNLDSLLTNASLSDNVNVNLNTKSLNAKTGSSVDNINNSTLTNGNVTVNNNLESLLTNASLSDNVNVDLNTKSLNAKSDSTINNINNSTITDGNVLVNNNLTSTLTDVTLKDNVNIDLNNNYSITANNGSSVSEINNSTITNGNISISNDLTSSLANVTLNNIGNVNLNDNSLTANNESTVSNINNSTITNGNVSINNNLTSSLANVVLGDNVNNNVNVNLNSHLLTANNGSSVSNINKSTITNGDIAVNNNLDSLLTDVVLLGDNDNIVNVNLKTKSLNAKAGSSISNINNSTITNGDITVNNNLTSTLTDVTLKDNVTVDLNNTYSLTTKTGTNSTVSNIDNSTITNGNVSVNNDLNSVLANVVLGDNTNVNLSGNSLNAKSGSSIGNIKNSTLTNGTLTINNDITSQVTNSNIENGTVDLNNHKLTANGDITLINITGGVITNTGTLETNGTITANQINSNLLKDQTGTNQIMAYDKDNKKITFCNHTTLTCTGAEDTLTTDNLVIDRITLNEVREVDGGIVTTGLKVGFPYWTDLGTAEQGSTINIQGNILHVVKVLVDGVNHYQLWVSIMDIEFSLKSTETKIITKGTTFEGSVLINSLDDLTLGENEHLYIKSANVPIANGKILNDMVINASINADGTINGKSLQLDNASINNDGSINGNSLQLVNASINNGVITGKSLQLDNASINTDGTIKGNSFNGKSLQLVNASISEDGTITGKSLHFDNASIGTNGVINENSLQLNNASINNGVITGKSLQLDNASINGDGAITGKSIQFDNASIDNNGVITGKSLQTNQISNENGDKSIIKYESGSAGINPKITLGAENVDLEIVGFDQKNIVCDTLTASNYVQSNLLQSNDGNNKSIIKYEPAGTGTNPKITLGAENVDLEIVGFDQKNIVCETLTATNRIKTDLIYSSDNNNPLIQLNSSTITVGNQDITTSIYNLNVTNDLNVNHNLTVTNDLKVDNNIYSDKIYSKQSTTTPIFIYDSTNTTLSLGDNTTKTKIARLCTNTIADYLNNSVLFSYADSNHLEIGNSNSNYLYTLIHKIRTNDPLYISSLKYWVSSTDSISLINYDSSSKIITIGDSTKSTKQETDNLTITTQLNTDLIKSSDDTMQIIKANSTDKTIRIGEINNTEISTYINTLFVDGNLRTNNVKSLTNAKNIISCSTSGSTEKITLGSDSTTQETHNLTVTNSLTSSNQFYSNKMTSLTGSISLLNFSNNYLEVGSSEDSYNRTLVRKFRSNEPLGISSIYYWSSSDNTLSIPLLNYTTGTKTITFGDNTTNISIPGTITSLKTNSIKDSENNSIISVNTGTITIGNDSSTQETKNLTVTNELRASNKFYSNTITSLTNDIPLLNYTTSPDTITLGNDTTNISIPNTLITDSIKDSGNNSIISVNTNTITIGSASTTQKTHNLTVDTNLTVANRIYADSIYSYNNTEKPLIRECSDGVILGDYSSGKNFIYFSVVNCLYGYWNPTYQIFGEKNDPSAKDSYTGNSPYNYVFLGHPNYAYTLIHNLRTNEPLYTPSIYYWPLDTAKTSAIPLLVYDNTNPTITLGNTTTNISIPNTLITNSIKDSETDSIISVDTDQGIITIGNDNKQTKIKNVDYTDIFNKIYVSIGQNIKFKIDPKIAIDKAINTVNIASITVTKDGVSTTISNVTAYQNADNIYNNYTTGKIFLNRSSTSTDTTTEVDVYIIPKNRNFFDHPTNTGPFYTKQTARMCFVFCNLYFIIKSPSGDETSSGLWTSSNGNVWYEFNPKDFNSNTGPYSDTTVTGAKFDILQTQTINNLSIGYIPRGWMTGYEEYEDHYVLGFPLITVSNEAYYASFLLYDYDEYMTREVTYNGGCTIL